MSIRSIILTGMLCVSLSGQFAQAWTNTATVSALRAMSVVSLGQTCPCDGDVDSSGLIQIQDILIVIDCTNGIEPDLPLTCEAADLNCDGVADFCDASRVYCQWVGQTNCCGNTVCGACCNSGAYYNSPCLVVSEDFCLSPIIVEGVYRGDGTTCDLSPCGSPECTTDADCNDQNICTDDVCTGGVCVHENVTYGTACPDGIFCNGDETCQFGVCQSGPSRTCDDGLSCTFDTCNVTDDVCVNTPDACNNDGVCDSPCEITDNCPGDCSVCDCVLDQDGSGGFITITDILIVIRCADGLDLGGTLSCDNADLNCDGVTDWGDVSRAWCAFTGRIDCCEADIILGACCNTGENFNHPCVEVSQQLCAGGIIVEGTYLGDGTTCEPYPCENTPCSTDAECFDNNVCTTDACTWGGICEFTPVENGTSCSDELYCNGDETCQTGVCQSGALRSCDDLNPCTIDDCNNFENSCVNTPVECNHDGVCDAPCENADNCLADCSSCTAIRDLSGGSMAYCSGVVKSVRINLNVPAGALAGAVEDTPPTGWIQISNISNGGAYDAANHKVKWGPFFAPFPTELTYDVLSPVEAVGLMCFTGSTVFDNDPAETICGDECIEDSCCPNLPADETQPVCDGCSDNCSATNGDGRVELCEVIRYACGWKRGCNDDITGVTGGAYIWMVSECFCWDEAGLSWTPETCGLSASGCCEGSGQSAGSIAIADIGTATVTLDSSRRRDYSENNRRFVNPKLRESVISVSINPPYGTSAVALELQIPMGMVVNNVSDGGAWDPLNRKVKWGPFFSDQPQTITVTVSGSLRRAQDHGLTGTVSYDGKNYPIKLGLNDQ